jgi:oligopeptidase B
MTPPLPPLASPRPTTTTLHGESRTDNYAWLRDRTDPATMAYLEAENAYTDAVMAHTEGLQKTLYDEMLARIQEDDRQVPIRRGEWFYYSRTETGKAYPIFCRKHLTLDADEIVFFDQNAAAAGFAFFTIGAFEVSPDHRNLALLVDTDGYEDFRLEIRDLTTGTILPDTAGPLGFGLAWASDGASLFFLTTDDAKRSNEVWRHRLGEAREQDVSVYRDDDVRYNVHVERARSGSHVVISSGSFTSGESWLIPADAPATAPVLVAPRTPDVEYAVEATPEWLYIVTNRDGARNFKVMRAPASAPSAWEEWLPHRDDTFIEGALAFRAHAVVVERHAGLSQLRVVQLSDRAEHRIAFDEAAYGVYPGSNPEYDSTVVRFVYASLVTPTTVYDYDFASRERTLLKRDPVLGGYDSMMYTVERLMLPARDGVPVPVSLVYRAPLVRDGTRPLLLYAYGSYGATTEPTFSSARFSLIDRGFIYAIAHVRGGQEMGRHWYDDGKMAKKENTFHDFVDVAQGLVDARYTSPEKLAANGGSAGGLLMGVIVNQRPDLFRAVVADVPFVDVINTMLDDSIPLTAQEWEQWGNPSVAEEYAVMRRYSPYDNVTAQGYPRMLVTSGINDSRVAYWEPAKWVAKLRATKSDQNVLLLKMNLGAGHGGASGRYERLKEQAFRYAFLIDQVL